MTSLRSRLLGGAVLTFGFFAGLSGTGHANDSLMKAAADPNGWAMYGRGYDNTRFSPLNSNQYAERRHSSSWRSPSSSARCARTNPRRSWSATRMYVTTSWGPKYVYALDAKTGAQKWTYEPDIPDDVLQYACCDVNNRGVTYADGKIFVGRLDGKLSAARREDRQGAVDGRRRRLQAGLGHHARRRWS